MIEKRTYTLTVLVDTDDPGLDFESGEGESLSDLEWLIREGPGIGQLSQDAIEIVPPEKLADELVAIGNDGTFFDRD